MDRWVRNLMVSEFGHWLRRNWLWLAFMLAIGVGIGGSAFADDDPPKTTLTICDGGLPSTSLLGSAQGGCHSVDVTGVEVEHAPQIAYQPQSFMHVYRDAGDPACVFTRDSRGNPGGGRDCRPEDHQCAFIAMGWHVFAVTGQSCLQAGVAQCTGPFCT